MELPDGTIVMPIDDEESDNDKSNRYAKKSHKDKNQKKEDERDSASYLQVQK